MTVLLTQSTRGLPARCHSSSWNSFSSSLFENWKEQKRTWPGTSSSVLSRLPQWQLLLPQEALGNLEGSVCRSAHTWAPIWSQLARGRALSSQISCQVKTLGSDATDSTVHYPSGNLELKITFPWMVGSSRDGVILTTAVTSCSGP